MDKYSIFCTFLILTGLAWRYRGRLEEKSRHVTLVAAYLRLRCSGDWPAAPAHVGSGSVLCDDDGNVTFVFIDTAAGAMLQQLADAAEKTLRNGQMVTELRHLGAAITLFTYDDVLSKVPAGMWAAGLPAFARCRGAVLGNILDRRAGALKMPKAAFEAFCDEFMRYHETLTAISRRINRQLINQQ